MFDYNEYPDIIFEGLIYDLTNENTHDIMMEAGTIKEKMQSVWKKISALFKRIYEKVKKIAIGIKDAFKKFKNKLKDVLQTGQAKLLRLKVPSTFDTNRFLEFAEKDIPSALASMGSIESLYEFINRACAYYKDKPEDNFPLTKIKFKLEGIFNTYFKGYDKFNEELNWKKDKPMICDHKDLSNIQKFIEISTSNGFYNKLRDCSERIEVFNKWMNDIQYSLKEIKAKDAAYIYQSVKQNTMHLANKFSGVISELDGCLKLAFSIMKAFNLAAFPGLKYKINFAEKEDKYEPQEYNPKKEEEPEYERPKYAGLI